MLIIVKKPQKSSKAARARRIRVPDSERAQFAIDNNRFVGVLQRSLLPEVPPFSPKARFPKEPRVKSL